MKENSMNPGSLQVLVPLDGSPLAESILPALMPLAARRSITLNLLQIIERVDEIESARAYLARIERDLERDCVEAVSTIEFGRPVDEIAHLAKPGRYDLLAMTTHGRTGLRRALLGSAAEGVLRQSKIPLLLNRPGSRVGDWNRIVVPVDGSAISETILEDAAHMALLLQATIHIVRISLPLLPTTDLFFRPLPEEEEDPQPYLEKLCDGLARQGVFAIPVVLQGFAGREIVKYAAEIGAGLIAMMTEGRSGVPRLLAGSVAEEVLRSAPCPVLVRRWAAVPSALEPAAH
jgi:nucleotide-binding universal stress UspA family protein